MEYKSRKIYPQRFPLGHCTRKYGQRGVAVSKEIPLSIMSIGDKPDIVNSESRIVHTYIKEACAMNIVSRLTIFQELSINIFFS